MTREEGSLYNRRLIAELAATPGIASVSLASVGNTVGWVRRASVHRPGASPISVDLNNDVSPGYFEMLDIRLLRGRTFRDSDTAGAPPVVVLNGTLSRQLWGDHDPVGRNVETHVDPQPAHFLELDERLPRGAAPVRAARFVGTEPAVFLTRQLGPRASVVISTGRPIAGSPARNRIVAVRSEWVAPLAVARLVLAHFADDRVPHGDEGAAFHRCDLDVMAAGRS